MYETLTLLLICLGHVIAAQQHDYKRIIVDVDMGMDDYQGIGILLQAENQGKLKIEAILCSKGNTDLKDVKNNVLRLLETAGRTDIPVYAGSEEQILPRPELSPYFGEDGFGDLNLTEPDGNLIHRTISPTFIHDLLKAYPKEFTLIALAPTTNIALALREFADVAGNFKDIFIMGGNFNSTFTEFNFKSDPEAAAIVLATADVPITILTWEGCMSLTSTFIPVYAGSEEQILPRSELRPFYGKDGFGDLNLTMPDGNLIHRTISPTFIHDLLQAFPKEFTLIALAPTTNIALALREFADVAGNFKDIFIMGGNFNSTYTEFNFKSDPEAAAIVLATADVPITILTWEGCLSVTTTFGWRFNITNISNPVWNLIDKAEREVFSSVPSDSGWGPCDAILCASVVYPDLILKQSVHNASVDLTSNRSLVIIDSQATNDNDVDFIEIVDTDRFNQVFVESFTNICNFSGSVCLPKYVQ